MRPVGGHGVGAGHGAEGDGMLVGALVAHHTHAAHGGEQNGARLPYLVVERHLYLAVLHVGGNTGGQHAAGLLAGEFHFIVAQTIDVDMVGFLQHTHLLGCDVAQDAHGQARSGEGMAGDEMLGHAQLASHAAHLVLEEPFQRLTQLQVHLLGQSAHIVVALDYLTGDVEALYTVGIDGALCKPFGSLYLLGFGIEHLYEVAAYDFAFLLRIGHSGQVGEELLAGIHTHHIQAKALIVVHHIAELVFAQHAVVYEDAGEPVADGSVQQHGGHGRVDTARKTQDDLVVAQLAFQFGDGGIDKGGGAPVLLGTADVDHEVLKQLCALHGVEHLGMELHGPYGQIFGGIGGELHVVGRGYHLVALGQGGDGVAMAHPHLRLGLEAFEERVVSVEVFQAGAAVLAGVGFLHLSALAVRDELGAVADAEHWQPADKLAEVYLEGFRVMHRIG